jgi:hypothetical protein
LVENLKPTFGKFTTTTDQTIHTANAKVSAGIEIIKFRLATDFPVEFQKSLFSGSQRVITVEDILRLSLSIN